MLIAIDLAGGTPWSYWGGAEYFPSVRLLHVPDGVWVRVSPAQAAMIASDLHPGGRCGSQRRHERRDGGGARSRSRS